MGPQELKDYLARDEELLISFDADSIVRGGESGAENNPGSGITKLLGNRSPSSQYTFGATDRRIVYLDNTGAFKDIDYKHVSSIETESKQDHSEQATGLAVGCCGGFLLIGGLSSLSDDPGSALLFVILGFGLLAAAVKIYQNADSTEKQTVKFITGDEVHQSIEVTLAPDADANVGAELSRILRKQR